jgi:hypothetical protein
MSLLFGKKPKAPAQTPPTKLAGINITQAVNGSALPILLGQRRLSQSLIYYTDFTAIPHVQQTASGGGGGKGLGGGGGSAQTNTTYTYTAATMGALCSGPVSGIVSVWDTKGRFSQTNVTEGFTIPPGGGTYTVTNHGLFKGDMGVGFGQSYSQVVNDFGSPGPVTLSGTYQVPMKVGAGAGQYTVNPSTGIYTFHAADGGKTVNITYSYNLLNINNVETATIPSTPFQILVQDSADFLQDSGVVFYPSGATLTKVASSPSAGQYTATGGGLYTFAAADTTKQVQISYVTNTQNQNSDAQTALNITLLNGAKGQTVWSYLSSRHPEAAIGYTETAIVASSAMDLGSNGELPNYAFEIAGPYQFGAGNVDCDPADCIGALLSDPFFGNGFPTSAFGDWTQASNFWIANNFFVSPLINSQTPVASVIGSILEAGMTAAFWSEGQLKLVPYGDTSAAANGQIYVPNTQPVVDLTDDDFLGAGVKVTRTAWQDANNKVQITWTNRLNGYNSEVTTEQDDAAIQRYGLRTEDPQSWDFICTLAAAQFAGNLRVKRSVNIRAQYTFSITHNYSYLEPMDLVTITVPELGWTKLPVRIQQIVDHPDENGLEITAEEFPWGTAQPTLYAKQTGVGFKPNAGQADPGNTTALIFEAPSRLGLQQGNILFGFVTGNSPDWGGCQPFTSFDGITYQPFGPPILNPARLGTLITTWAPTNLITNGDGETGSLFSQATGWTFGSGVNLVPDSTVLRFGTRSLRIINTIANDSFSYQDLSVTSGTTYELSGWIKTGVMPSADPGLGAVLNVDTVSGVTGFTILSKSGTDFAALSTFSPPSHPDVGILADDTAHDWTFVSSIFQPIGTGTIRVYCQLGYGGIQSGTAWFDNVAVSQLAADPDPTNFQVAMTSAGSQLPSMSTSDFNQSVSLCAIVDAAHGNNAFELFSYKNSTLVGANTFQLDTFHRGLMGTQNVPHNIGDTFARLDQASFTYQYDPSYYGKTITFKFCSFNTLGGRPQPLSQAAAFPFVLPGSGPGTIDLNTGIYRPGLGNIPPSWKGSIKWASAVPGTTLNLLWDGTGGSTTVTVVRGTMPNPNQASNTVALSTFLGNLTVTGLTASTNYWVYPYVDDANPTAGIQFVTNSQASGAVGTPAICYTALNNSATYIAGRNDHLFVNNGPLAVTTAPSSGSGTGGSGTGDPTCPRGDMVVEHIEKGVVRIDEVIVGDKLLGKDRWVTVLEVNHHWVYDWVSVVTECGETIVVTPNHTWPTPSGDIRTPQIEDQQLFLRDGRATTVTETNQVVEGGLCVGLVVSGDQCYFIGSKTPCVLTHNGNILPRC